MSYRGYPLPSLSSSSSQRSPTTASQQQQQQNVQTSSPSAQIAENEVNLGYNCLHGLNNTEVNHEKAYAHFLNAAHSEHPSALVSCAMMLIKNQGQGFDHHDVLKDVEVERKRKAKVFLQQAIKRGSVKAMFELAKINLDEGLIWDATKLLSGASRLGHLEALVLAGKLSQLRDDREDAVSKWAAAAKKGSGGACNELGVLHYHGHMSELVKPSKKEAFAFFSKAAILGSVAGCNNLGMCYEMGHGTQRDITLAIKCYEKSSGGDFVPAMSNLGRLLLRTSCVDLALGPSIDDETQDAKQIDESDSKDFQTQIQRQINKAVASLRKASDLGDAKASFELGSVFRNGVSNYLCTLVPIDLIASLSHFKRCVTICRNQGETERSVNTKINGYPLNEACKMCAEMLYSGCGGILEPDYKGSLKYYNLAADNGDVEAMNAMGIMYEDGKGVNPDCKAAANFFCTGRNTKSRPFAGMCSYNLGKLLEKYLGDGEIILKIRHAESYISGSEWAHTVKEVERQCSAMRAFIGSQLNIDIKKNDLNALIKLYKDASTFGYAKAYDDEQRVRFEKQKENDRLRAVDSARGIDVFGGEVDEYRREVVKIGSGVFEKMVEEVVEQEEKVCDKLASDDAVLKTVESKPALRMSPKLAEEVVSMPEPLPDPSPPPSPKPTPSPQLTVESAKPIPNTPISSPSPGKDMQEEPSPIPMPLPTPSQSTNETKEPVILKEEDNWDDIKIGVSNSPSPERKPLHSQPRSPPQSPLQSPEQPLTDPPLTPSPKTRSGRQRRSSDEKTETKAETETDTATATETVIETAPAVTNPVATAPTVTTPAETTERTNITTPQDISGRNSTGTGGDSSGSGGGDSSGSVSYESSAEWYYKDEAGDVQGPFESEMMNEWVMQEMLPKNQLVREGKEGPFAPLSDIWDVSYGVDKSVARSFHISESPIGRNKSMHQIE